MRKCVYALSNLGSSCLDGTDEQQTKTEVTRKLGILCRGLNKGHLTYQAVITRAFLSGTGSEAEVLFKVTEES